MSQEVAGAGDTALKIATPIVSILADALLPGSGQVIRTVEPVLKGAIDKATGHDPDGGSKRVVKHHAPKSDHSKEIAKLNALIKEESAAVVQEQHVLDAETAKLEKSRKALAKQASEHQNFLKLAAAGIGALVVVSAVGLYLVFGKSKK